MAYYRCTFGGGSSELTETLLWQNSSPTSGWTNTAITLSSDQFTNYKYIKVEFLNRSDQAIQDSNIIKAMLPVEDFKKGVSNCLCGESYISLNSGYYVRALAYSSNVKTNVLDCYKIASSTTQSAYMVPYRIYGLK